MDTIMEKIKHNEYQIAGYELTDDEELEKDKLQDKLQAEHLLCELCNKASYSVKKYDEEYVNGYYCTRCANL
jgi:hypothetical protein